MVTGVPTSAGALQLEFVVAGIPTSAGAVVPTSATAATCKTRWLSFFADALQTKPVAWRRWHWLYLYSHFSAADF